MRVFIKTKKIIISYCDEDEATRTKITASKTIKSKWPNWKFCKYSRDISHTHRPGPHHTRSLIVDRPCPNQKNNNNNRKLRLKTSFFYLNLFRCCRAFDSIVDCWLLVVVVAKVMSTGSSQFILWKYKSTSTQSFVSIFSATIFFFFVFPSPSQLFWANRTNRFFVFNVTIYVSIFFNSLIIIYLFAFFGRQTL